MMAKCLIQRWPITPEQRQEIVEQLLSVVSDPNTKTREKLAAAKALIDADGQNQKDEQAARKRSHDPDRYLAIAERLGIADRVERG